MADGMKRNDGEPVFDAERAWIRFERRASREPAPAFWKQAAEDPQPDEARLESRALWDGNRDHYEKDGAIDMKRSEVFQSTETLSAARVNGAHGVWRTERPAKRRLRRWTAGVAAAVMAVGLFATPMGDRALAVMMQTFRIQHMVGVEISADDMATISSILESGSPEGDRSFSLAQYGTLSQSGGGEARTVTWDEAEQKMGGALLRLEDSPSPEYQPATTLTLNLKVDAVNRLLTRLGGASTLPAEANGKAIRLHIPDGVASEGSLSGKPVRLLQFGKPELAVEDGIDPAQVREAVLGLPVLPDSLRTKLAAIGDWQSTLPVPARDGVTSNLRLNGHDAIMTEDGGRRYLLWLDGERMGLLSGDMEQFPAEADFRQAAEELILP
ncbi:hypothetical protein FE782_10555 [Paenibacillus antri]|uniref:DUF4367 domain-containing protein n=1 Tax=Paenibacillus antri TaxID=2582848 RepID=A0A5R9GE62_9BACL|nr:hypothetical protein [Paenibacillus antri]TLS52400.1 hypothetical protein FE782_10555 [Paenibacillus antri]